VSFRLIELIVSKEEGSCQAKFSSECRQLDGARATPGVDVGNLVEGSIPEDKICLWRCQRMICLDVPLQERLGACGASGEDIVRTVFPVVTRAALAFAGSGILGAPILAV